MMSLPPSLPPAWRMTHFHPDCFSEVALPEGVGVWRAAASCQPRGKPTRQSVRSHVPVTQHAVADEKLFKAHH